MPKSENGNQYQHEDYSAAIIRTRLQDVIEGHLLNQNNYDIKADDVASLLEGSSSASSALLWKDIISGQMDADRMDYLLRDSHHIGVEYGRFDLHRFINTIRAILMPDDRGVRFGITEGGWHAAEALVLARYFMFTQVYFHRVRVAYDIHLRAALKSLLPGGVFPRPNVPSELDSYLSWDDWKVLGLLADGKGGEHGTRLSERNHYRVAYQTPSKQEIETLLPEVRSKLGNLLVSEETASKSWYKMGRPDIPVVSETRSSDVRPLSQHSAVVGSMKGSNQTILFVKKENLDKASQLIKPVIENK